MKFTPRLPRENVNVSSTHPLAELLWLTGGLVLIALSGYLLLGLLVDWAAESVPVRAENWLGAKAAEQFPAQPSPALQHRLDLLLDRLPVASPLHDYSFRVSLQETPEVNAFALPGGRIVVFSGLLEQVESENELAMVLAHELGHYAHRDHLRRLGRGFGVTVAAMLLLGKDSFITDFVSQTFLTFEAGYSRTQETAADDYGLKLLVARYGHAGGAVDLFRRMTDRSQAGIAALFASHPHPDDRIAALERVILNNGYPVEEPETLEDENWEE
ncbi:MAG: peptidase M48 [Desulfuromonas sp.]|nr:MAG: peptidase M48 [Desulfuromonas sp.]